MSDRPIGADAAPSNSDDFPQMSRAELYDIMYKMKILTDEKPQQARQILTDNPQLTRFLFQAQIMLGMMGSPRETPTTQLPTLQHPQQAQTAQAALPLSGEASLQEQTSGSQTQVPVMKQMEIQPAMQASASIPTTNPQSQSMPLHPLQTVQQPKGHLNIQMAPSQVLNTPPLPTSSASQPPLVRPQMPTASNQFQQPLQAPIIPHMPLQPPLPPHPRLPLPPSFQHQHPSQMGSNMAFQQSGSQLHHSQPVFHAQPQIPNQPPSQSFNQIKSVKIVLVCYASQSSGLANVCSLQMGGSHLRTEFSNAAGSSMQVDRGSSSWMPPRHENTMGTQLPGPPPLVPGQMGSTNPSPRPQLLNPEMEKALLQQVMSLTPEQINRLPPEQRHQILQLQQMLRQ
ncbi:cleavage stimulating factor 64-like isoform X2 [Vitis riparia]|uniref:cleavage stimulating factor 64-like isoform X2 n=1 Tax=Vitis riparia TaxID=96939 RepID=UPI00155A1FB0|nr:cleavage stimulating factor 64-like isoform X2 [Vitis riparia]